MTNSSPSPADDLPKKEDDLRQTLDRIAAALEKRNEQSEKQAGADDKKDQEGGEADKDKEGGAKDKKEGKQGEGDGKDKKDGDDKGKEGDDKKPSKAKRFFTSLLGIIVILAVLAVLIIGGITVWHYESTHVSTDDAYTAGHVHQISPRVSGLVTEVWVDDNQQVKEGALLVKLDPRDYEVSLERAQAGLDQAKAQVLQAKAAVGQAAAGVEQAEAQVAQARAQVTQANANFQVATINYNRNNGLFTKDLRAVSKSDVDTTKGSLDASQATLEGAKASTQAAEASADAAKSMKESREAELVVAQAQVENAQASYDDAKLQLSYCWVLAPCDGRVSRKTVETGFRLSAGQSVLAVTENVVWVLANLKETQLQNVRVGQPVKIAIDAYPKHPFTGVVNSIQNGTGGTYSLLPPDNATGNFTKIVQRVPVKIVFDHDSIKGFEDLIVPGLSNEPVIDISVTDNNNDHVYKDNPAPRKK